MAADTPLSSRARALLWTLVGLVAIAVGWFVAARLDTHLTAEDYEAAMEAHAWSMASLRPGVEVTLPSFPVPPDESPPTFKVTVNSDLLRERDFSPLPSSGVTRIIAVGDSTTFGTGVPAEVRFTNRLQSLLGSRYEVLNAGRPGMTAQKSLDLIEQRVIAWRPAILVFGAMTNDLRDPDHPTRLRASPNDLMAYKRTLRTVIRRCKEEGITLVFWSNTICPGGSKDPLHPYQQAMAEVAKESATRYLSLDALYRKHPATKSEQDRFLANRPWTGFWPVNQRYSLSRTALHLDWAHPNAAGHTRLSNALGLVVRRLTQEPRSTQ